MRSSVLKKSFVTAAAILLALMLTVPAFGVSAEGLPTVTVSSVSAKAGETVDVTVTLSGCEKYSSYTVNINYDNEYITAVGTTKGIDTMLYMPNLDDGTKTLIVAGGSTDNITENGVLFTANFTVSADYAGGITVVPLTVTSLRITEYNGSKDAAIETTAVDGQITVSGAGGDIVWEDASSSQTHNLTPGTITEEEAGEYTNPLTGETVTAGEYYFNSSEKIAVPASDAEEKLDSEPDAWKLAEGDEASSLSSSSGGQVIAEREGGPDLLTVGLCVGGALIIILAAVLAYILLRRKQK